MRGGTSRGPFFRGADLPAEIAPRDRVLLAVMGSPDVRQIDGLGGAHPLTSKVNIVSRSAKAGIDEEVRSHFRRGQARIGTQAFLERAGGVVPDEGEVAAVAEDELVEEADRSAPAHSRAGQVQLAGHGRGARGERGPRRVHIRLARIGPLQG